MSDDTSPHQKAEGSYIAQAIGAGAQAHVEVQQFIYPSHPLASRLQTPPPPVHFIPRPEIAAALKSFLLDQREPTSGTSPVLAIHGMGGVGKSTLAVAVARDQDVIKAFPDGILWAEAKA